MALYVSQRLIYILQDVVLFTWKCWHQRHAISLPRLAMALLRLVERWNTIWYIWVFSYGFWTSLPLNSLTRCKMIWEGSHASGGVKIHKEMAKVSIFLFFPQLTPNMSCKPPQHLATAFLLLWDVEALKWKINYFNNLVWLHCFRGMFIDINEVKRSWTSLKLLGMSV